MSSYFARLNVDGIRLAIGVLVTQALNAAVLLGIASLDADQLAAINGVVGTALMLAMYFVKPGTVAPAPAGDTV